MGNTDLIAIRRLHNLRLDNGPEFIANRFKKWCDTKQINLEYIQPVNRCRMNISNGSARIFSEDKFGACWFEVLEHLRIWP